MMYFQQVLRISALACALSMVLAAPASAATFRYRIPSTGLSAGAGSSGALPPLSLSLAAASLPNASRSTPYSFDFATLLSMSGDGQPTASQVTWSATGTVPAGLSLSANGLLSGTPTTIGSGSFQVTASYTDKSGQQTYTLLVNGVALNVTQLAAGSNHTCAVTTAGAVKCWGDNAYGQLGDGTTVDSAFPVTAVGLSSGVSSVSAKVTHSCAVTSGGAVKCWGNNTYGQLGDGTTVSKSSPTAVTGLSSGIASVDAGAFFTCAVTTTGGIKCWGYNAFGELGDGTTVQKTTPVNVLGMSSGVASVSVGYDHACSQSTTGQVQCWGYNAFGQLGDGTTTSRTTAGNVNGLGTGSNNSSLSAHANHTCAKVSSGVVNCWGYNNVSQLGDGTTTNRLSPFPVQNAFGTATASVTAGPAHGCAVSTAGAVKCWGQNTNGQLGDGTTTDRSSAVSVLGLSAAATRVITGGAHTCAIPSSGPAQCWGRNTKGQTGNGTPSASPVLAPTNVVQ